jgi:non-homologous end joining protein Ku
LGDDIPDEKYQDMLDLASHIVESKAGHFEPCGARVSRSLVPCADILSLA